MSTPITQYPLDYWLLVLGTIVVLYGILTTLGYFIFLFCIRYVFKITWLKYLKNILVLSGVLSFIEFLVHQVLDFNRYLPFFTPLIITSRDLQNVHSDMFPFLKPLTLIIQLDLTIWEVEIVRTTILSLVLFIFLYGCARFIWKLKNKTLVYVVLINALYVFWHTGFMEVVFRTITNNYPQ